MQLSHRTASVGCVRLAAILRWRPGHAARGLLQFRCEWTAAIPGAVQCYGQPGVQQRLLPKSGPQLLAPGLYVLRRLLELARRLRPDARCGARLLRTSVHLPANVRSTASAANAAGGRHRNLWRGVPAVQPRCAAQSALRADGQHQGWAAVLSGDKLRRWGVERLPLLRLRIHRVRQHGHEPHAVHERLVYQRAAQPDSVQELGRLLPR